MRKIGKINENEVVDVATKLKDFNPIFKGPIWFMRNFVAANLTRNLVTSFLFIWVILG